MEKKTKILLLGALSVLALVSFLFLRPEGVSGLLGASSFKPAAHFSLDEDPLGDIRKTSIDSAPVEDQSTVAAPVSPPKETKKSTVPQLPPALPLVGSENHIVISEIQLTGGTGLTTNDFIELYNPTGISVSLSGWKLRKRTQSGTESSIKVFEKGKSIPAHGFFLWANTEKGFAASIGADESSGTSIAANNSIALQDSKGAIIDAVAWGENLTNPFLKGIAIVSKLEASQSFERKAYVGNACVFHNAETEFLGNGCDTNNNGIDFELRPIASPQNSKNRSEP